MSSRQVYRNSDMEKLSPKRQLAAIMFTDIAGYTALMGSDEENALKLLRKSRTIHKEAIEKYNGKWLKEMGDGILAQFGSAVDGVKCALEIQEKAVDLGAKIRIGIHLGDVSIENEDVFGDGVNIASRIQAIADPGGIYLTEDIYHAIRSQAQIKTQFIGEVRLKNVDYPVKAYYLVDDFLPIPDSAKLKELIHTPKKKKTRLLIIAFIVILASVLVFWWNSLNEEKAIRSIVVLPVENLTGNPDVDFYTEGIHDAINNEIGKIGALRVPSTRTSLKYKGSRLSIPEIAGELNVDGVIEPALIQVGENIQIRIKLIRVVPEERQIWSQDFSRDMSQIISLYSDVASNIARELNIELSPEQVFHLSSNKKVIPQAYEAYLRGMSHWYKLTKEDLDQALRYFELALEIDPDYAQAYAGVAMVWGGRIQQGIMPGTEAVPKVDSLMQKALELDSTLTEVHYSFALFNTWWKWDWEKGGVAFKKTIQLNPKHAGARAYYSHYLNIIGKPEDAIPQIEKALDLDPINPLFQAMYGMDLNYARKFDQAIELLNNTLENAPGDPTALSTLRSAYHNNKEFDKAYEIFVRSYEARNDVEGVKALKTGYTESGYSTALIRLAEMLIARSETQYVTPWRIGTLYTRAGKNDKAVKYLNLAYEDHDSNMPYINIDPIFNDLKSHPGFQDLLVKMDFPGNE